MRITGGSEGGRRLVAPTGHATRPTSARTREAIFDVLASRWFGRDLAGVEVLDLYAGAGTLGLEALSRGASRCVFIDRSAAAARAIRQNLEALGLGEAGAGRGRRRGEDASTSPARARVLRGEVLRELGRLAADADEEGGAGGGRFRLVFVDPPYAGDEAARAISALARSPLLAAGAVVVVEHASRQPPAPPAGGLGPLAPVAERRYGDTSVTFYEREGA